MSNTRHQIIAFASIGLTNTLLHGVVLWLVVEVLGWAVVLAHLLAFSIANMASYVLNSHLTFKAPLTWAAYFKFLTASLVSLFLTLSISWWAQWYGLHYRLGFFLVIVMVPSVSFVLMKFWAFKNHKK